MANRLASAISPYLRSHADNPVNWYEWGEEPFNEAARRDVPVLVSLGYSTCHWCHVMARESFSDPELAAYLNENFITIKVDREEHPDVDASYLAAASAFTQNLGWPLNVFVTPEGKAFFAGTYWPPLPMSGHPSFRQILEAVQDAWMERRDEVDSNASAVAAALAAQHTPEAGALPTDFAAVVRALEGYEDTQFGGFGNAPKFPVAPVLNFLLEVDGTEANGVDLALRILERMAASDLRDEVEGGFFRYSTMRDWTDPHYERMLYDNAQLLDAYTRAWKLTGERWAAATAHGIADFLDDEMQLAGGGFASAQDSESTVDGERVEGGYYKLTAAGRSRQTPPALDEKVLTGWNGLAISALARAGFAFGRTDWLVAARRAADFLLERHLRADGVLVRASVKERTSVARATLEDYGMFAGGLLELALALGEERYATAARSLLDAALLEGRSPVEPPARDTPAQNPPAGTATAPIFAVPGGHDPVLAAQGVALAADPSEGAYPSGITACADAAYTLYLLTAQERYLSAARAAMAIVAEQAVARPIGFGGALGVMSRLASEPVQLVVVAPDAEQSDLATAARTHPATLVAVVTEAQASAFSSAGFELFEGRVARNEAPTAYLCRDFVCQLPVATSAELASANRANG